MKTQTVRDPYRGIDTTLTEFAKAEGVKQCAVAHYHWYHGTLEGFRDRPKKYSNGLKPHTYMKDGKFVRLPEAERLSGCSFATLARFARQGVTDVDEIRRQRKANRMARLRKVTGEDGVEYTVKEFAEKHGATVNMVHMYLRNHGGTVFGFADRGGSRVRPTTYANTLTGEVKTVNEWAEHFKCSKDAMGAWVRKYGNVDRFAVRLKRRPPRV